MNPANDQVQDRCSACQRTPP